MVQHNKLSRRRFLALGCGAICTAALAGGCASSLGTEVATSSCPYGEVNDPYPGKCHRYMRLLESLGRSAVHAHSKHLDPHRRQLCQLIQREPGQRCGEWVHALCRWECGELVHIPNKRLEVATRGSRRVAAFTHRRLAHDDSREHCRLDSSTKPKSQTG